MAFSRIRKNLPAATSTARPTSSGCCAASRPRSAARADEPGFIERGVLDVMQHLHTDLPPAELFRLAQAVAQVDPTKITTCVVQGGIGNIGGASVVLPDTAQARRFGDGARKDATLESCEELLGRQ